ncbi:MAG: hypothetical protein ACK5IB_05790 [Qingshengfaniella sp.]
MKTAINQMAMRRTDYAAFLDLGRDLGRSLFDGTSSAEDGKMTRARGLPGVGKVYNFNAWSHGIGARVGTIIAFFAAALRADRTDARPPQTTGPRPPFQT